MKGIHIFTGWSLNATKVLERLPSLISSALIIVLDENTRLGQMVVRRNECNKV